MKIRQISIEHYRSIEEVTLVFPEDKPLVLFGPNNAGKSNIISAINRFLGERYSPTIEMLDSDWFLRDKDKYPRSYISCEFDRPYSKGHSWLGVQYDPEPQLCGYFDARGEKVYVKNSDRRSIQCFLVDAERSISYQLSYSSRFTLLSKFSHAIHNALGSDDKGSLEEAFQQIKSVFQGIPEFSSFMESFTNTVNESVQGFTHKLEADFSAYDPNNYANSMRILAKEGNDTRSFEEFGTGEQQVLLMAFAKAYMQTFGSESIVLIFEEPEAHLHPLAQKWLKEYIYSLCEDGIQVVISTHSPDFVDPSNIEGLVRVGKNSCGITEITQLSNDDLAKQCIEMGVPETRIGEYGVSHFYKARMTSESLKGLFAKKVLLVEGPTELLALPAYFKRAGYSCPANGLEVVCCNGKGNIPSLYRLFTSFGIDCYCLFDGDESRCSNSELSSLLKIAEMKLGTSDFVVSSEWAYFSKDFETTIREQILGYSDLEDDAKFIYKASGKPAIAHIVAETCCTVPLFVNQLIDALGNSTTVFDSEASEDVDDELNPIENVIINDWRGFGDDIPF